MKAESVRINPALIHHRAYVTDRHASHEYIARHLGEVTMVDHWLGKLFDRLETLPGRTLLVITTDHGESLGDANLWFTHGENIRWPCMNVPLIIACDGVVPTGVSDALVANIDLAPTVLEMLGISKDELNGNGRSVQPTFTEADPWPQRMIPILTLFGIEWRGVRSARFCLQTRRAGPEAMHYLYDVKADPHELFDVAEDYPDELQRLLRFQRDWFSKPGLLGADIRNDPDMMRHLRSLGYLQ